MVGLPKLATGYLHNIDLGYPTLEVGYQGLSRLSIHYWSSLSKTGGRLSKACGGHPMGFPKLVEVPRPWSRLFNTNGGISKLVAMIYKTTGLGFQH